MLFLWWLVLHYALAVGWSVNDDISTWRALGMFSEPRERIALRTTALFLQLSKTSGIISAVWHTSIGKVLMFKTSRLFNLSAWCIQLTRTLLSRTIISFSLIHWSSQSKQTAHNTSICHISGRYNEKANSIAIPFLPRPTALDGSHAGDYGFDPLGLSEKLDFYAMQESEVRHAR